MRVRRSRKSSLPLADRATERAQVRAVARNIVIASISQKAPAGRLLRRPLTSTPTTTCARPTAALLSRNPNPAVPPRLPPSSPSSFGVPCASLTPSNTGEIRKWENARSPFGIEALDDEFQSPRPCRRHALGRCQSSPSDCRRIGGSLLNSGCADGVQTALDGQVMQRAASCKMPAGHWPCALVRLKSSRRN